MEKYGGEWGFDQNAQFQFRAPAVKGLNKRQRQNRVPQGSEADQSDACNLLQFPAQQFGRRECRLRRWL